MARKKSSLADLKAPAHLGIGTAQAQQMPQRAPHSLHPSRAGASKRTIAVPGYLKPLLQAKAARRGTTEHALIIEGIERVVNEDAEPASPPPAARREEEPRRRARRG